MQETILCLEKHFTSLQAPPHHPELNASDTIFM